jgi:hypothetical protein
MTSSLICHSICIGLWFRGPVVRPERMGEFDLRSRRNAARTTLV